MNSYQKAKDIIDFWNSIEQFTPPEIKTDPDKVDYNVDHVQKTIFGNSDLPWLNREKFNNYATNDKSWVHTIFLGIINIEDVTGQIKEMLAIDYPDYDLQTKKGLSCLASFQLDIYGKPIKDSLVIPDYFLSMGALTMKEKYPDDWLSYRKVIKNTLETIFENLYDRFKSYKEDQPLRYEDLLELLNGYIAKSNWTDLLEKNLIYR